MDLKVRKTPKKDPNKGKSSSLPLTYFEHKRLGHKSIKCPMLKKKSHKRPTKKKSMMDTWDNEHIPSKEEQDDNEEEI